METYLMHLWKIKLMLKKKKKKSNLDDLAQVNVIQACCGGRLLNFLYRDVTLVFGEHEH